MENINEQLVTEAKDYVTNLINTRLNTGCKFHTIKHTLRVLSNAELIASETDLTEDQINTVRISALFHDAGYVDDYVGHEAKSAEYAAAFLRSKSVDEENINLVVGAILATKIPQQPKNIIDKIVCDADLMHLASDDYFEQAELIRQEWTNMGRGKLDKYQFELNSLTFFREHRFKTEYGRTVLQAKKEENAKQLGKRIIEHVNGTKQKKKGKKSDPNYSRGVESMFRLTARNQINLSAMADNKSNILISVNAIIISVVISMLATKFNQTPEIVLPTLIFLTFCVLTIIFAILSTRPTVSTGRFTTDDIEQNKVNLLFFGNFYNMEYEAYEEAIGKLLKNDKYLYSTMIKDQFLLGKILAKKYKLLKIAYNIFLVGIVLSVIVFGLVYANALIF